MPSPFGGNKIFSEKNSSLDMQLKNKSKQRADPLICSTYETHCKRQQDTDIAYIITLCVWGVHFMYMYMYLLYENFQIPKKKVLCHTYILSKGHFSPPKRSAAYENDIVAAGLSNGSSTGCVLRLLSGINSIKTCKDFPGRYSLKEHVHLPLLTITQELEHYHFQYFKINVYNENMDCQTCDCIGGVNAMPALKNDWDKPKIQKAKEDTTKNKRDNKIRRYSLSFIVAFMALIILRCFFPGEKAMKADGLTNIETSGSSTYFNQTVCSIPENGHLQRCRIESYTSGKGVCNIVGMDVEETLSQYKNVLELSNYDFDGNFTEQNINKDRCTPEEVVCSKDEVESKHLMPPQTNVIVPDSKELRRNSSLHDIGKDRYIFEEGACGKDGMESRHLIPLFTNLMELGNIKLNENSPFQNTGKDFCKMYILFLGNLNGCYNNRIRRVSFVPLCKGCMNGVFPTVSRKISISRIDFGCYTCQWFAKQLLDMVQILIPFFFMSRGFFLKGSKQRKKIGFCRTILIFELCLLGTVRSERTNCSASISTMTVVNKCPRTEIEWKEREEAKRCQTVTQECTSETKFKYHCLLNEWGNATVEVCAEVWFINCHCAEYNTGAGIVQESVDRPFQIQKGCRYKSNIHEYEQCRVVNKTALPPYIQGHNQTKGNFFVETNMQENRKAKTIKIEEEGSVYNEDVAIILITLTFVLVVCISLSIFFYKRRQDHRRDNQGQVNTEVEHNML
ncbi:uncharacterized protein LOC134269947 [Saccostrea cucullata]|uniref:uncharacterized protein LOC134269947 n=1 Tax=Saccostrea cuccullata TaxID=36930 RepID=UPI002ECFF262